jgi:hypothetical protein
MAPSRAKSPYISVPKSRMVIGVVNRSIAADRANEPAFHRAFVAVRLTVTALPLVAPVSLDHSSARPSRRTSCMSHKSAPTAGTSDPASRPAPPPSHLRTAGRYTVLPVIVTAFPPAQKPALSVVDEPAVVPTTGCPAVSESVH